MMWSKERLCIGPVYNLKVRSAIVHMTKKVQEYMDKDTCGMGLGPNPYLPLKRACLTYMHLHRRNLVANT